MNIHMHIPADKTIAASLPEIVGVITVAHCFKSYDCTHEGQHRKTCICLFRLNGKFTKE